MYGLQFPNTFNPNTFGDFTGNYDLTSGTQVPVGAIGLNPNAQGITGLTPQSSTFSLGSGNSNGGFGFNVPTLQLGLQGINSLFGGYMANKQLKMVQDQFDFQKQFANTNLNNNIKAYNTGLEDRLRSRAQFNSGNTNDNSWQSDFDRLKATK